jgi:hypothetical protein
MPSLFMGEVGVSFWILNVHQSCSRHQLLVTESLAIIIHIRNAQVQKSVQLGDWADKSSLRCTIKFWTSSNCQRWNQPATGARSSCDLNERLFPKRYSGGQRSFPSNWREAGLEHPWNARRRSKALVLSQIMFYMTLQWCSWSGWNRLAFGQNAETEGAHRCFLEFRKLMYKVEEKTLRWSANFGALCIFEVTDGLNGKFYCTPVFWSSINSRTNSISSN